MSNDDAEAFNSVGQTLEAVEEHLAVFKQNKIEDLLLTLCPLGRAKMHVSIAYTINALLFIFLKTQGVSTKDIRLSHVKQELGRVQAFIKKIKDAEEMAKGPQLVLDKDASRRFIDSALSTDQVYVNAGKAKKGQRDSYNTKNETNVKAGGKGNRKVTGKSKRQRHK